MSPTNSPERLKTGKRLICYAAPGEFCFQNGKDCRLRKLPSFLQKSGCKCVVISNLNWTLQSSFPSTSPAWTGELRQLVATQKAAHPVSWTGFVNTFNSGVGENSSVFLSVKNISKTQTWTVRIRGFWNSRDERHRSQVHVKWQILALISFLTAPPSGITMKVRVDSWYSLTWGDRQSQVASSSWQIQYSLVS